MVMTMNKFIARWKKSIKSQRASSPFACFRRSSVSRVARLLFDERCTITSVSSESINRLSATLRREKSSFRTDFEHNHERQDVEYFARSLFVHWCLADIENAEILTGRYLRVIRTGRMVALVIKATVKQAGTTIPRLREERATALMATIRGRKRRPIVTSSLVRNKNRWKSFTFEPALHKTIAASPSPLKFTPASEDKNGSSPMGMTSMLTSPATTTTTTTTTTTSKRIRLLWNHNNNNNNNSALLMAPRHAKIKLGDVASLETIMSSGQVDPNYRDGHGFTL